MSPYELGVRDAQAGLYCLPELYFVRRAQIAAYTFGYLSINPLDILAQQILHLGGLYDHR